MLTYLRATFLVLVFMYQSDVAPYLQYANWLMKSCLRTFAYVMNPVLCVTLMFLAVDAEIGLYGEVLL